MFIPTFYVSKNDTPLARCFFGKARVFGAYARYRRRKHWPRAQPIFPNRTTVDIDPARKPDVVADAHALPFPDASFELVLCTEVLEHLVNPPQAIAEMYRVLTPGGTLILTTRFVYPLHDAPHDYFRFTRFGLEKLLEHWSDVSITPELSTMATLGCLAPTSCVSDRHARRQACQGARACQRLVHQQMQLAHPHRVWRHQAHR
jgi:SAM-dependent methyltransferase